MEPKPIPLIINLIFHLYIHNPVPINLIKFNLVASIQLCKYLKRILFL